MHQDLLSVVAKTLLQKYGKSIEHPGCVWDAKFLENGDIVTACSDGVVHIWTICQDNVADQLELDLYTSQLSQYKSSRKRVGGLKLEELPGLEALKIPEIGEVVDGPEDTNRPFLDGIEYDYVFNVDIGDGMPLHKLPYNQSDNPYDADDKWLLKESLPLSFREQIIQFILQNTGQKDITFDASFHDLILVPTLTYPDNLHTRLIVKDENVEVDSKFCALVAVGSLMLEGLVKKIALDFDVLNIAKAAKDSKEAKIDEVGADIELLTKQS